MNSETIGLVVFACVFSGALLGMLIRSWLPEHHVSGDARDVMKLGIGLIATTTALVLGLLTASAKSAFDTENAEIRTSAANLVLLDRTLAQYGPEAAPIRAGVKQAVAKRIELTWPASNDTPVKLDSAELRTRADGSFEIFLSKDAQTALGEGQQWMPIAEGLGTLIVRQSRLRPDEVIAELRIERLGGDGTPAVLTGAYLDDAFEQSASLVSFAPQMFAAWAGMFQAHVNQLPRFDQEMSNRFGGLKDIAYYHSYWRLADDEALVIEATPPRCDHWNFQLNNHWMESLDYRFHRIHVNSATASTRADGRIRVIVAHTDPGLPNWIETIGHRFGTMCFRWVRPELPEGTEPPVPSCRVVKHAELAALD